MLFPESLKLDFDVLDNRQHGRILPCYHVQERRSGRREFMMRLLPDSYCQDTVIVNAFHDFFTRFAEISNKTNVPQVYSVTGSVNGPVYVLEEFVSGMGLKRFVDKRKGSKEFEQDSINIISRVCEALHYAHQKDIFHLSIAPDDILIDENNPGKVKLVGFGAQIFVESNRSDSLPTEVKKYVAPEVLDGKSFGPSADVYSLAAAIKEVFPETGNWDALISRRLSKTASDRPSSARAFAQKLKDLLVKQTSGPTKQPAANNSGGLQPLINIKTTPEGAQVSLNGASVGITTASGLRIPWKQGLAIEIAKPGFATETLKFTEPPDNSEITIKLKSTLRLFTNPWGASVLIDGKQIGVTDRDGLMVPWDGATIEIQKPGYKPEILKFVAPPINGESCVVLQSTVPLTAPKLDWKKLAPYLVAGCSLWILTLVLFAGIWGSSGSDKKLTDKDDQIEKLKANIAELKRDVYQKDIQIEGLKKNVATEKQRGDVEQQRVAEKEREIRNLRANTGPQQPAITARKPIDPSLNGPLFSEVYYLQDFDAVERLLDKGADPNATHGEFNITPLMHVAAIGHKEMIKLLLKHGANVNAKDTKGWTAEDFARQSGEMECLKLLVERKKSGK